MAPNSLVLATVLIFVANGAVGFAPHGAEAASASVSTSVRISGVVPCSAGSLIDVASAPVFPNAGLQLVCGSQVVASATADGSGFFLMNIDNVATNLLTVLLGNQCKVVVTTPLAACDASLAGVTGTLTAPLKLLGASATTATGTGGGLDLGGIIGLVTSIVSGLVGGILNLVPQSFSLV